MPRPPIPRSDVVSRGGTSIEGSALQRDLGEKTFTAIGGTSGTGPLTIIDNGTPQSTVTGVGTIVLGDGLTVTYNSPGIATIDRTPTRITEAYRLTEDEGTTELFPLTWVYLDLFDQYELQIWENGGTNPTDYVVQYYNGSTWVELGGDPVDVTTTGTTGATAPEKSGLKTIDPAARDAGGVAIKLVGSEGDYGELVGTVYFRGSV